MSCKLCKSSNQSRFESEITIHFPDLKNLKKVPVVSFANLVICLDCGFMESKLAETELRELTKGSGGTNISLG